MRITFDLSDRDLRYFRDCLKRVKTGDRASDERVVVDGAMQLVQQALATEPPDFVRERIGSLRQLVEMLRDAEWRLEGEDRTRVLSALAYFVNPDDLIPDRVPGIGYLDDAIMVELVVQELRHEIHAYADFCEFRKSRPRDADAEALETRRRALQMRMRRRRRKERRIRSERASSWSRRRLIGLF
jgi:uncharacterized membrane protein YkvA (DUF1232 family)